MVEFISSLALALYRQSLKLVLNKLEGSLLWVESSHALNVRKNIELLDKVQKQEKSITVAWAQKVLPLITQCWARQIYTAQPHKCNEFHLGY